MDFFFVMHVTLTSVIRDLCLRFCLSVIGQNSMIISPLYELSFFGREHSYVSVEPTRLPDCFISACGCLMIQKEEYELASARMGEKCNIFFLGVPC